VRVCVLLRVVCLLWCLLTRDFRTGLWEGLAQQDQTYIQIYADLYMQIYLYIPISISIYEYMCIYKYIACERGWRAEDQWPGCGWATPPVQSDKPRTLEQ